MGTRSAWSMSVNLTNYEIDTKDGTQAKTYCKPTGFSDFLQNWKVQSMVLLLSLVSFFSLF